MAGFSNPARKRIGLSHTRVADSFTADLPVPVRSIYNLGSRRGTEERDGILSRPELANGLPHGIVTLFGSLPAPGGQPRRPEAPGFLPQRATGRGEMEVHRAQATGIFRFQPGNATIFLTQRGIPLS